MFLALFLSKVGSKYPSKKSAHRSKCLREGRLTSSKLVPNKVFKISKKI
jgi:hypothetical protein